MFSFIDAFIQWMFIICLLHAKHQALRKGNELDRHSHCPRGSEGFWRESDNEEIVVRWDEDCSLLIYHMPTTYKVGSVGGRKRNEEILGGR